MHIDHIHHGILYGAPWGGLSDEMISWADAKLATRSPGVGRKQDYVSVQNTLLTDKLFGSYVAASPVLDL